MPDASPPCAVQPPLKLLAPVSSSPQQTSGWPSPCSVLPHSEPSWTAALFHRANGCRRSGQTRKGSQKMELVAQHASARPKDATASEVDHCLDRSVWGSDNRRQHLDGRRTVTEIVMYVERGSLGEERISKAERFLSLGEWAARGLQGGGREGGNKNKKTGPKGGGAASPGGPRREKNPIMTSYWGPESKYNMSRCCAFLNVP